MATLLRLRSVDDSEHELPIAEVTAAFVLSSVPWRTFRSHRRQSHLSGYYWSSTTGGHVIYESRLEPARLLLADADPEVMGISAQPFLVEADGRRHVPDFFLDRRGEPPLVVNVKPAERLSNPARVVRSAAGAPLPAPRDREAPPCGSRPGTGHWSVAGRRHRTRSHGPSHGWRTPLPPRPTRLTPSGRAGSRPAAKHRPAVAGQA